MSALFRVFAAVLTLLATSESVEAGDRPSRIGVLTRMSANPSFNEGLRDGLHELGYVEGKNVVIEWRSTTTGD